MTTRKKYRLTKLRLDEISIVDQGACDEAVVTIFKRDTSGTQPGADDTRLSDPKADAIMSELVASIRKARDLIGQLPSDLDPKRLRGTEAAIAKLAEASKSAQITLRQFQARQSAEAVFKGTGLTSLSDLRAEVAKAEDLPNRLQAHRDNLDLDVLREAQRHADTPRQAIDRARRREGDRLDEDVKAEMASGGGSYTEALDRLLAERKRTRGG